MARLTIAMLDEWHELDEERKGLAAKSKTCGDRQKEIEAEVKLHVEQNGGKAKSCTLGLYTMRLKLEKVSIQWKNVVLRLCGKQAVDDAAAAAETREKLVIDRAA